MTSKYFSEVDYCSKEGAAALRRRIERYWAKQNYQVRTKSLYGDFTSTMRSGRYDVRSDMVDGLPRRRL